MAAQGPVVSGSGLVRWALVTVSEGDSPETTVGIQVIGSDEIRAPSWLRDYQGVFDLLQRWDEVSRRLQHQDPQDGALIADPHLHLPVRFPRKVLCSGPNFTDHLAEMGESGLGDKWSAYYFFKPPTTTLIRSGDPVLVGPDWPSDRVDWEGELAVVIGRGGRDIDAFRAPDHIAGYLVANDISLRGPHRRDTPAAPFVWDWAASKAADTSLPIGPGVVPAWQVPDVQALRIRTWVNGELKQDGSTADMVLDVATLVADASALITLEAGDLILTGTPAGVGVARGTFLGPGDIVDVEIEGIGRISNPVDQRGGRK